MLSEFQYEDWENFKNELNLKSLDWKLKFIYLIDSSLDNSKALECISILLTDNNEDLFEGCLDALRDFDIKNNRTKL